MSDTKQDFYNLCLKIQNGEDVFSEVLKLNIEIKGKTLPLWDTIYSQTGETVKSRGWLPKYVRSSLQRGQMFEYEYDILNEVAYNLYKFIKDNPIRQNIDELFFGMVVKCFIPQVSRRFIHNFKVTDDKLELIDGEIYRLINYRYNKEKGEKKLLGRVIPSSSDSTSDKATSFKYESASNEVEEVYVNTSGYITTFADIRSLSVCDQEGYETVQEISYEEKGFKRVDDDYTMFMNYSMLLEIDDDVYKKLLYLFYLIETADSSQKKQ